MTEELKGKLSVLFIIDFITTLAGGTESQLFKLINGLDKRRYAVTLLSLRDTEWLRANANRLECSVKTLDFSKLRRARNVITIVSMFKYIKRLHPDIVMTFFPLSNILGVLIARLASVETIFSSRRDYGLWLNWIDERTLHFLRFANRFVTRIIVNAQSVKDLTSHAENVGPARIIVIHNGIDVHNGRVTAAESTALRKQMGIPPGAGVVGIVGGLKPMKRHKTFLMAAKRILACGHCMHFVIVGDGALRIELERMSEDLGINDSVHFVGSQENVFPFVSLFDVAVNCSSNEGLSNAIMEYMVSGVPCIASASGGNEELIEDGVTGCTFNLDNDEELAHKIVSLMEDEGKRREFATKAREKVLKELSVEGMIHGYDGLFRMAVSGQLKNHF